MKKMNLVDLPDDVLLKIILLVDGKFSAFFIIHPFDVQYVASYKIQQRWKQYFIPDEAYVQIRNKIDGTYFYGVVKSTTDNNHAKIYCIDVSYSIFKYFIYVDRKNYNSVILKQIIDSETLRL